MTFLLWAALGALAWAALLTPLHFWFTRQWTARSRSRMTAQRRVNRYVRLWP